MMIENIISNTSERVSPQAKRLSPATSSRRRDENYSKTINGAVPESTPNASHKPRNHNSHHVSNHRRFSTMSHKSESVPSVLKNNF